MPGTRMVDKIVPLVALHAVTPSSSSPRWVSLKNYNHCTILVSYKNATGVTGSAIGLQQATSVAGTGAKPLNFSTMFACTSDATNFAYAPTPVVSNTFTTDATASVNGVYMIEVDAATLDMANGFNAIQVTAGNATAATLEVTYLLSGARFGGGFYGYANPLAD